MIRKDINYEELEGKEVEVTSSEANSYGITKVIVAAIDPEVGITLVDANNKERLVACLRMPGIKGVSKAYTKYSEEVFEAIVEAIQKGVFDDACDEKIRELRNKYDLRTSYSMPDSGVPAKDCAFS